MRIRYDTGTRAEASWHWRIPPQQSPGPSDNSLPRCFLWIRTGNVADGVELDVLPKLLASK